VTTSTRLRDAGALLTAWETAASVSDVARAAVLVAHSGAVSIDGVLDLSLASCARLAVSAYIDAFGAEAECTCICAACGEMIDIPLDLRDFDRTAPSAEDVVPIESGARTLVVQSLTTRDLLVAAGSPDPESELRRRCVRDVDGQALPPADLAALGVDDLTAVDAAADRLAGLASILLRMRCPGCGEDTTASLDPGVLIWERVAATAPLLLAEVAALARAFGWSEDAVLALGTARRRAYLELSGAFMQSPGSEAVGR
jgi:hypothetical protein